jgi:hypothetical protein
MSVVLLLIPNSLMHRALQRQLQLATYTCRISTHKPLQCVTNYCLFMLYYAAGGDESGDFIGSDSDAMAGIAAGYSATTLLTVTSIAALTGVMLARILS